MWKHWHCERIKIEDTKTFLSEESNNEARRQEASKTFAAVSPKRTTNDHEDQESKETTD